MEAANAATASSIRAAIVACPANLSRCLFAYQRPCLYQQLVLASVKCSITVLFPRAGSFRAAIPSLTRSIHRSAHCSSAADLHRSPSALLCFLELLRGFSWTSDGIFASMRPIAFFLQLCTAAALLLAAAQLCTAAESEDCIALGFTGSQLCSDCDTLASYVKDDGAQMLSGRPEIKLAALEGPSWPCSRRASHRFAGHCTYFDACQCREAASNFMCHSPTAPCAELVSDCRRCCVRGKEPAAQKYSHALLYVWLDRLR